MTIPQHIICFMLQLTKFEHLFGAFLYLVDVYLTSIFQPRDVMKMTCVLGIFVSSNFKKCGIYANPVIRVARLPRKGV